MGNPVDHVEEKESFLQGKPGQSSSSGQSLFAGGGEMGRLMRSFDWSEDPLGPPETWSPALQSTTRLVLANCSPMLLWWEPDFLSIYNDAYIPVLGDKHPHAALGKPLRECWSEVFPVLEPLVRSPLEGGPPTWMEDIMLEVNRFGFVEETPGSGALVIGCSPSSRSRPLQASAGEARDAVLRTLRSGLETPRSRGDRTAVRWRPIARAPTVTTGCPNRAMRHVQSGRTESSPFPPNSLAAHP